MCHMICLQTMKPNLSTCIKIGNTLLAFIYIPTPGSDIMKFRTYTIASEEGLDESVHIWNLKRAYILVSKLKKIKTKFLRCTGYLNSIKKPYKARFIANSRSCTTTELSKLLTSCLTAIKKHVIKYCEKVYERSGKNLFWSIKNSGEILDKLKARDFNATSLSTYDFSTLYTTLPHNLIKDKLINLIERTFQREGSPYLACSDRNAFFTSEKPKNIMHGRVRMYVMR